MTLKEFIDEHAEVGRISDGWHHATVLACKHCGAFLWDVEKHMEAMHGIEREVGE